MERRDKKQKSFIINSRPIISLLVGLGFLSVILIVTMIGSAGNVKNTNKSDKKTEQEDIATIASDGSFLAVVKELDTGRKLITLYDVEQQETVILTYTGGTNITDKYGQIIAMSQIQIGTMVEAGYQEDTSKLASMNISTNAWEYIGVSNLNINRSTKVMKIATTKYKYTDDLLILDGQDFIPVTSLEEQDELTVRGYDDTICSITVTRGHGTVKLADYEVFLGASITVGYESMQQITEDMIITVREGNFNLTVENGKFSATKNITILRNKETIVSLSDLGPGALSFGRVIFEITPFGADLYLDGELISYANPLELSYDKHTMKVSLGGYTTYEGILQVDSAGKTIKIDLPESKSNEDVVITETDTESGNETDIIDNTDNTDTTDSADNNDNDDNVDNEGTEDTDTTDTDTDTETPEDETVGVITDEDAIIDEDHFIYVQNPLGASVYLNGDFMGTSPCIFSKAIGSHVLTFIQDGYVTMSYTVDVMDDNVDTYFNMPDLQKK